MSACLQLLGMSADVLFCKIQLHRKKKRSFRRWALVTLGDSVCSEYNSYCKHSELRPQSHPLPPFPRMILHIWHEHTEHVLVNTRSWKAIVHDKALARIRAAMDKEAAFELLAKLRTPLKP